MPRRDLDRKTTSSGHRSTVRRKCRQAESSTEKKNRLARSARTRRSVRSRRVEPGRKRVRVVGKYGADGKMHLVQCRVDSVKHATSPSRRDTSRRVIHVASDLNFSPLLPNIEMSGAATPRTSVRLDQPKFNPPAGSAFPASALVRRLVPSFEALVALGKFGHRTAVLILL